MWLKSSFVLEFSLWGRSKPTSLHDEDYEGPIIYIIKDFRRVGSNEDQWNPILDLEKYPFRIPNLILDILLRGLAVLGRK